MDIKYNVSKYKDSKIQEIKDSISVEEPLEMRLRFKKNDKWQTQNISITMRTPNNDQDLIRGFLFNEGIIENLDEIDSIEQKGDESGAYTLKNPSNIVAGQSGSIFVVQPSAGGKTLGYEGREEVIHRDYLYLSER